MVWTPRIPLGLSGKPCTGVCTHNGANIVQLPAAPCKGCGGTPGCWGTPVENRWSHSPLVYSTSREHVNRTTEQLTKVYPRISATPKARAQHLRKNDGEMALHGAKGSRGYGALELVATGRETFAGEEGAGEKPGRAQHSSDVAARRVTAFRRDKAVSGISLLAWHRGCIFCELISWLPALREARRCPWLALRSQATWEGTSAEPPPGPQSQGSRGPLPPCPTQQCPVPSSPATPCPQPSPCSAAVSPPTDPQPHPLQAAPKPRPHTSATPLAPHPSNCPKALPPPRQIPPTATLHPALPPQTNVPQQVPLPLLSSPMK